MINQMIKQKRKQSMDEEKECFIVPPINRNDGVQTCQSKMENKEEFDKESFEAINDRMIPRTSNQSMDETIEIVIVPKTIRNDDQQSRSQNEFDEAFINESKTMSVFKKSLIAFAIACIVCISTYYFLQTTHETIGRNLRGGQQDAAETGSKVEPIGVVEDPPRAEEKAGPTRIDLPQLPKSISMDSHCKRKSIKGKVMIVDKFLNPAECEILMEWKTDSGPIAEDFHEKGLKGAVASKEIVDLINDIVKRLKDPLNQFVDDWSSEDLVPRKLIMLNYSKGEQVKVHRDGVAIVTATIYLNTNAAGGALAFGAGQEKRRFQPAEGMLVIFDSQLPHAGEVVLEGRKALFSIRYVE